MSNNKEKNNRVKESGLANSKNNKYTYGDYLTWSDDRRYEIIDGVVYNMTPAPSRRHQEIVVDLVRQFSSYLLDKKCKVFVAPFDVRLPEGEKNERDIATVVQPDLIIVCDSDKLDKRGCKGVPDLIIEIVSPSSGGRDRKTKRALYERFGVQEYWMVDYAENTVEVYILNQEGEYGKPEIYTEADKVPVNIIKGLQIDMSMVFKEDKKERRDDD